MAKMAKWRQEEIDLLYDKYGLVKDEILAARIGRTVGAIKLRAERLGITRRQHFMTANEVAEIFGCDMHKIVRWIEAGQLRGGKSKVVKTRGGHYVWQIMVQDLEAFIQAHTELYLARNIDRGLYPYWRNQAEQAVKKAVEKGQPLVVGGVHWTEFEDAYLCNHRAAMTYSELAARLNRTKEAVHGRITKLRHDGRMMPFKKEWRARTAANRQSSRRMVWSQQEDEYLRLNCGRLRRPDEPGHGPYITWAELAAGINRTKSACEIRASRLGITGRTSYSKTRKKAG